MLWRRATLLEAAIWTLVAFACATAMRLWQPARFSDDSYQYLSVARNIYQNHAFETSLVHFDTERSHGRVPAPLTTFPPGYPVLIAAASTVCDDPVLGARIVSNICFALTVPVLLIGLILAGVAAYIRQVTLLLFTTNITALHFSTAVLGEPVFTLFITAAITLLISVECRPAANWRIATAAAGYTLVGLAYWVRYAGLFLIAATVGYALLRLILHRDRFRVALSLTALILIGIAGIAMLRNVITAGTWKGGNELVVHNPAMGVVAEYARSQFHLFLGGHRFQYGWWELLMATGGLGIVVLLLVRRTSLAQPVHSDALANPNGPVLLITICVSIYTAGMLYAGLRTVISFGTRMFVPALPLYLLLIGIGLSWLLHRRGPRWFMAPLLLTGIGYAGVNARDLYPPRIPSRHETLSTAFGQPMLDGQPLRVWVESHIPPGMPIVAADGQATGYLLDRPTVSMIESHFSSTDWECSETKNELKRFGSHYVILYRPSSIISSYPLLAESQFASEAVTKAPPCGFTISAENQHVRILRSGVSSPMGRPILEGSQ